MDLVTGEKFDKILDFKTPLTRQVAGDAVAVMLMRSKNRFYIQENPVQELQVPIQEQRCRKQRY